MANHPWPASAEVHAAVAERLSTLLDEQGGLVAEYGRRIMSAGHGVLSAQPSSARTLIVPAACVAAGGAWQLSAWPSASVECMMAAADLFDDVADADITDPDDSPGVLLTVGAGLFALATTAVTRVVADGVHPTTAVALAEVLGSQFAAAANGQATSLRANGPADARAAYQHAASKSGPLGALMATLGARTATDDARLLDLLSECGRRLAVRDQLLNDARDAAPDPTSLKADVRAGAATVPLAFTGSRGAPEGLSELQLQAWEAQERARIAAAGGITAALALAHAERLHIDRILGTLDQLGSNVTGLRALA